MNGMFPSLIKGLLTPSESKFTICLPSYLFGAQNESNRFRHRDLGFFRSADGFHGRFHDRWCCGRAWRILPTSCNTSIASLGETRRKARHATCELNWINHLRPALNKFGFNHQAFIGTLGIFSCHEMLGNATILRDPAINRSNTGENGGIIGFKTRILSLTEWQCWSWKGGTSRTKIESDVSPLKIQEHSFPTNMVKWQNQSRTMGTRWENNPGL
jgi:hypothetical protein